MPRIQGLFETFSTADLLVKACAGEVHSITIAYKGATAGDLVLLRDGLTGAGSVEVAFVLPAGNGTITKEWPQGKRFDTGIYLDIGALGAGIAYVELTCK